MTLWQKFTGALRSPPVLAATIVLSATAPSLAGMTAAQRVALVEEVKGKVTGVEFMDYVRAGQIIRLGPQQSIVLAYVRSCLRETITGPGTVTIGTDRSDVQSAEVRRTQGQCNVGKAIVPDVQGEFGARSFRGPHSRPEGEGEGSYSR